MLNEEDDLRSKLDQSAVTLADKVRILDAWSKYIRLHRERQTNIGKFLILIDLISFHTFFSFI